MVGAVWGNLNDLPAQPPYQRGIFPPSGQRYGNVKKGDELVEGIEAGVLASVLNIHDRVRGEVYKLGQVLLRPAFGFSSALDFLAQGAAVQTFSYWYILTSPLCYFIFRGRI